MVMIDWRGWNITFETVSQISNGDINARNRFYFDNLERIRKMAYGYARKNSHCKGLEDDMINGVWVDLGYFKQDNGVSVTDGISLSRFVYSSFRFCPFGGLLYCSENNPKLLSGGGLAVYAPEVLSFDKPFGVGDNRHQDEENARTLGEIIPAPEMTLTTYNTDELKALCSDLLPPRCREYFAYFMDGYSPSVIGSKMGFNGTAYGACGNRMRKVLQSKYKLVLARLSALGVDVKYYLRLNPADSLKSERKYKLTDEQRARARKSMRRYRERKKALQLAGNA